MKLTETCGCFPTGKHYPGIAHLLKVRASGVVDEFDSDGEWQELTIACLDTETTGTDANKDRVIEVGVVLGRNGAIMDSRSWLIDPQMAIPKEASAVHGISDEDVKGQPSFGQVAPEIAEYLMGAVPAAYNADFDRRFMLAELERAKVQLDVAPPSFRPEVQWLDPLVFARELYPGKQSRALGAMCKRLGISLDKAHRATNDAEAALKVLGELAKDQRVPKTYGALVQEQRRLARIQEEARRFWRK